MALALLLACVVAGTREAHAGDPRQVWKTIETRHFVIHYHEPLERVARHVAAAAERSHELMVPVFGHEPRTKTQIAIVDDTDSANGFAGAVPRNRIRLFSTAPDGGSTLNDHDDWLFILTAHEYAHVLHLDSIGGLPRLYNKIFGKTWSPNQVQPRWVIEGIATFQESRQSSGGRVRSAIFDMYLRTAVLAGGHLDLDAVTNGPRAWPRGNAPYLYGSHFLDYVFSRHGDDKLREMSWSYGRNPIPYSLNRTIQRSTGKTFVELYDEWREHLRAKYALQVEAVERAGLRDGRRLTFSAEGNHNPAYTRDGAAIVWTQSDGYSRPRYRSMPVGANAGQATDHALIEGAGSFELLSDGSMVVERYSPYRTSYDFRDLYRWDRATDTLERLTHGLRATDPAISPDESQVAFAMNARSQTRLAVMALRPHAEPRVIWEGEEFDQAGMPAWSPDGSKVALSAWTSGGYRDILVVDVDSGAVERVTHDRAIDLSPRFSPDGAYLYYVSDRSGIYNVYALDLGTRATYQVTNVLGGAFSPAISPDGARLVYTSFVGNGYDLYEIDLAPERWLEPVPYVNARPEPVAVSDRDVAISAPRPYRAIETLSPQNYTLQLGQGSFGRTLGIQTDGSDVVGWHGYSLGATISLEEGDVNVAGSYRYSRLWPALRLGGSRERSRRSGLFIDGVNTAYTRESYRLTMGVGLPVLRSPDGAAEIGVDYDLDWVRRLDDQYTGPDPGTTLPFFPESSGRSAGLALRWSYSDLRGALHTVGPQRGQVLAASLRVNHPAVGSDTSSLVLGYRYETYRKLPWGTTSSLAFRLMGGIRAAEGRVGAYALGGVPQQDLVRSIIESLRVGASGYLRGYRPRAAMGGQYHLANIEIRQQLYDVERGLDTLPVYVRRLHWAALLDTGNAFDGQLDPADFKISAGAALRLDMMFGYFIPGSIDVGYARGLTADGTGEYWLLLTGTL